MPRLRGIPSTKVQLLKGYGAALLTSLLALLLTWLLMPLMEQNLFLFFFTAVVVSAWYGGLGPGLSATALNVLVIGYFFIPPSFSLNIGWQNVLRLALFTLAALLVGSLAQARRRAEAQAHKQGEELQVTLARYQLLSEHARDIMLFIRDNGRIIEANQAAVMTYGYDRETLLSMTIYDLRAPDTLPDVATQLHQAASDGILFETRHRRKDGSIFPVEVSSRGATIGNQRLLVSIIRDISERKRAEDRQRFLSEIGVALTSSLDYKDRLQIVARLVVPQLADWCIIDMVTASGSTEHVAVAHTDPSKAEWARELRNRFPPDPQATSGVPNVIRTGRAELYPEVTDAMLVTSARTPEELAIFRTVSITSVMIVPLIARDRRLGAVTFVSAEGRRQYDQTDLDLAEELAQRAAVAIDNARLYAAEQQARQGAERAIDRITRLQSVMTALSEAITPAQVAVVIIDQGIAALRARAGAVVLCGANRAELELVSASGYPEHVLDTWRRFPITARVSIADAVRSGEPIWLDSRAARTARYPQLNSSTDIAEDQAWVALPLQVKGRTIGGMGLSFGAAQSFSADDRTFMLALARQCAQALERARLYEAEQQARDSAEAAVRLRDQFLSIAAHELKTPLTSLLGYAQLFQRRTERESALSERDQRALQVIVEQATRLNKMILALLDISRIETGQLSIERTPMDICALVRRVVEESHAMLEQHELQLSCPSSPLIIVGDELRLEQVLQNLLQNAVKYSPPSATIVLKVEQHDQWACVAVTDQGIGIPQEALSQLFQRFYRAPNVDEQHISGMGVGLYVVKEIVDLHSGKVTVESVEGQGSTFTIWLPTQDSFEF